MTPKSVFIPLYVVSNNFVPGSFSHTCGEISLSVKLSCSPTCASSEELWEMVLTWGGINNYDRDQEDLSQAMNLSTAILDGIP